MTFAAEKDKQATLRHVLVRVEPRRAITKGLVLGASITGGKIYSYTFKGSATPNVRSVSKNGVDLTATTTTPTLPDYYYWNAATKTLQIGVSTADAANLSVIPQSVVYLVTHELYFTTEKSRVAPRDPLDDAEPEVLWEGRITQEPSFSQDLSNIERANLSIGYSPMQIANADRFLQQFLTCNDSFSNARLTVWWVLGESTQKIFTGLVRRIELTSTTATLNYFDLLGGVRRSATFGDSAGEIAFNKDSSSFPNMDPGQDGTPCPMVFGPSSRDGLMIHTAAGGSYWSADPERTNRAVNTNFSATASTTTNRQWGLCRAPSSGFRQLHLGSIDSVSVVGYTLTTTWSEANGPRPTVRMGDTVKFAGTSTYYGVCTSGMTVGSSAVSGSLTFLLTVSGAVLTTSMGYTAAYDPVVVVRNTANGKVTALYGQRDFTSTPQVTTGGNWFLKVTLANNFEANHSSSGVFPDGWLDPEVHEVHYIARNACNLTSTNDSTDDHRIYAVIKRMIEDCDLTMAPVNGAVSYNGADDASRVQFQVPYFDESEPAEYLKYIEDLCYSRGALVFIGQDDSVGFQVYTTQIATPSDFTHTEREILADSWQCDVDFEDVVTQAVGYNPHAPESASATVQSLKASLLHATEKTIRFRHLLYSLGNSGGTLQALMAIKANRSVLYRFATATTDIDRSIGDTVYADDPKTLAVFLDNASYVDSNKKTVVVGVDRSLSQTTITTSENISDDKRFTGVI